MKGGWADDSFEEIFGRVDILDPFKNLWMAVVGRALLDANQLSYGNGLWSKKKWTDVHTSRLRRELLRWAEEEIAEPYNLRWIAEACSTEPDLFFSAVRNVIIEEIRNPEEGKPHRYKRLFTHLVNTGETAHYG